MTVAVPSKQDAPLPNPPRQPRPLERRKSAAGRRAVRQQGRHEHQRQHPARHHAVPDQQPELPQRREIDEHEPIERRRGRQHAQEHARGRPAQ